MYDINLNISMVFNKFFYRMPWQGHADNLIDRFDVRAHLDYIPPHVPRDNEDDSYEERQCNYERYRILAQNTFLGINEEKFLKQLHLEEQFGYTVDNDKEKKRKQGAAIGNNFVIRGFKWGEISFKN